MMLVDPPGVVEADRKGKGVLGPDPTSSSAVTSRSYHSPLFRQGVRTHDGVQDGGWVGVYSITRTGTGPGVGTLYMEDGRDLGGRGNGKRSDTNLKRFDRYSRSDRHSYMFSSVYRYPRHGGVGTNIHDPTVYSRPYHRRGHTFD